MTKEEATQIVRANKALYPCEYRDKIEAMSMAIAALREKQERENIIRDIKADMKPDDTYSVALVLELLGDKPAHGPCFTGQSAHGGDGHA